MNMHRNHITIAVSVAAFALAAGPLTAVRGDGDKTRDKRHADTQTSGQQQSGAYWMAHGTVQIASDRISERGLQKYIGQEVRGVNGEQVGSVEDFILDTKSGKVAFGVVASGGIAGIGEMLRLVPYSAIKLAANDEGFTTPVEQSQWNKLPVVDKGEFADGRINLTADQQRELAVNYGASDADVTAGVDSTTDALGRDTGRSDFGQRMVRATELRGKSVRAGNQEIGEVEDIVIDFQRGTASALLDAESDFTGTDRDFLVSLRQLQVQRGQEGAITTELTRADFQRAQPHQDTMAAARPSQRDDRTSSATTDAGQTRTTTEIDSADRQDTAAGAGTVVSGSSAAAQDEQLTPTGRTDATARSDLAVDPAVESAARSVQQIWEAHPELAKLDLRATVQNGAIVLQGSVPNADLWERAKDTAEGVVRGINVENRITIKAQ